MHTHTVHLLSGSLTHSKRIRPYQFKPYGKTTCWGLNWAWDLERWFKWLKYGMVVGTKWNQSSELANLLWFSQTSLLLLTSLCLLLWYKFMLVLTVQIYIYIAEVFAITYFFFFIFQSNFSLLHLHKHVFAAYAKSF